MMKFLYTVADPDFELRWGPGFALLALPAFLTPVISSFFTQNKGRGGGGGVGSPGPYPGSITAYTVYAGLWIKKYKKLVFKECSSTKN